ncbi:MAG: aminoglycoside 6-adenylyltransferase [Chloroflexota bacterium]|nr:aminoglycoside 6-adenylyltransferase [Chloroflexota bacterium]
MSDEWLLGLPNELALQRAVMRGLIEQAKANDRIRVVVVGCSIGRGNADALSDVDAYVGVADDGDWRTSLPAIDAGLPKIGPILDLHHQFLSDAKRADYRHTFIQYEDGVQVDLVVSPAFAHRAPDREWVVLYDPDGRVSGAPEQRDPTGDQVRTWMFGGLGRLSAAAKYLTRGSLWEAHASLEAARGDVWRLWAVAINAPDPQYGLTAVLDTSNPRLPAGIERTIAPLDRTKLQDASISCLDLLTSLWPDVTRGQPLPPFVDRVRTQLLDIR